MEELQIKKTILRKLVYLNKWGGAHTSFDNLPKGFPGHIRGEVKDVAKQLIKENFIRASLLIFAAIAKIKMLSMPPKTAPNVPMIGIKFLNPKRNNPRGKKVTIKIATVF
ncbi:MAG: hypothetical protein AABX39_05960, partial [Nanoarchaeota archaeon]